MGGSNTAANFSHPSVAWSRRRELISGEKKVGKRAFCVPSAVEVGVRCAVSDYEEKSNDIGFYKLNIVRLSFQLFFFIYNF